MSSKPQEIQDVEDIQEDSLEVLDGDRALAAVDRAAIDRQIATAKEYPRSVQTALNEAMTLATLDEETAASCFYAIPRGGKTIEGPSARLAEIMAYSWGNLRADADIVAEDKTHVTAMGTAFDLEKNVAVRVRVKRRITDRNGRRYNEDMIGVTSNAAISIALRNAVFKVVPQAFTKRIYEAARKASIGQGGTITQKRQSSLQWFAKVGVQEEQVFELLGVRGVEDIGEDELVTLRGLATAIKDGETTVDQVFTPARHSEGTEELNEALAASQGGQKAEKPPQQEQEQAQEPRSTPDTPDDTPEGGDRASQGESPLPNDRAEARKVILKTEDDVGLDRRIGLRVRQEWYGIEDDRGMTLEDWWDISERWEEYVAAGRKLLQTDEPPNDEQEGDDLF